MSDVEIEIPPTFDHLAMVRSVLSHALGGGDVLKLERVHDLRLAVSEGTTNAIEAHQDAGIDVSIRIRVMIDDDAVRVVITDRGHGFDPDGLTPHPPVTDPERLQYERGLGVTLMRRLTDVCDIDSGPDGTIVTLTMHR